MAMLSFQLYIKDHLGNIRAVVNQNNSIEEINHYYPYGSLFGESTGLANSTQPYKYTSKELDRMHGLDLFDYGARYYDSNLCRWNATDYFAEAYYGLSPYVLCAGNPINAKDYDGNLIVFINGWHWGNEGASPKYWEGFDTRVQQHFNDYHVRYYDGSHGGLLGFYQSSSSKFSGDSFVSNLNGYDRYRDGYFQGNADARRLLASLSKDSQGNYTETLRVVSHSMGGAFSKGFLQAIIDYAQKNKIDISSLQIAEYDFAPFHPENQQAVKGVKTYQYSHQHDWVAKAKKILGTEYMPTSMSKDKMHSIKDFFDYVNTLLSGTYEVKDGKIIE